jgi:hypothetical protein
VILAKALMGSCSEECNPSVRSIGATDDSWKPERDWLVFRDGKQLVPLFVIHFEEKYVRDGV